MGKIRVSARRFGTQLGALILPLVVVTSCGGGNSQPEPPLVASVSADTTIATAVTIDVLAHASDPQGGALTINAASVASPDQGTVAVIDGRSLLYTPAAGFSGVADLSYDVSDVAGLHTKGNVAVTVHAAVLKILVGLKGAAVAAATNLYSNVLVNRGGTETAVSNPLPNFFIATTALSRSGRYLAYLNGSGSLFLVDFQGSAVATAVADFAGVPQFTGDDTQLWYTATAFGATKLFSVDLPSGSPVVRAGSDDQSMGIGAFAFANLDALVFYNVLSEGDNSSGVYVSPRLGVWSPQRVTPPLDAPTAPVFRSVIHFNLDAAGDLVTYSIDDPALTPPGSTSIYSVLLGDPTSAELIFTRAPQPAESIVEALVPAGNLAFFGTQEYVDSPIGPILGPTSVCIGTTRTPLINYQCYLPYVFSWLSISSDGAQAAYATAANTLNVTALTAPAESTVIDTGIVVGPLLYTADGHWLVYGIQASSTSPISIRAWNTTGTAAPVTLGSSPANTHTGTSEDIGQGVSVALASDSHTVAIATSADGQSFQLYLVDLNAPGYAFPVAMSAQSSRDFAAILAVF